MELVDFLRARLDEDEAIAREAAAQYGSVWTVDDGMESVHSDTGADVLAEPYTPRAHIARHDPARVLAEVEAKRALIDEVFAYEAKIDSEWGCGHGASEIAEGLCPETWPRDILALRLLARPFRAHPDFDPAWLDD